MFAAKEFFVFMILKQRNENFYFMEQLCYHRVLLSNDLGICFCRFVLCICSFYLGAVYFLVSIFLTSTASAPTVYIYIYLMELLIKLVMHESVGKCLLSDSQQTLSPIVRSNQSLTFIALLAIVKSI